jgi:AraC-like DNA-binding protein
MAGQDTFFHYLPVDEETMKWGLYVTGAGRATIRPGEPYPPSGHPALYQFDWMRGRTLPEFQLLLISEGAGEFDSAPTGNVQFRDSALLFLFPGVWHRYRPLPRVGWTERWISFNGDVLHRLFDPRSFGPKFAVSTPEDGPRLVAEFDKLLEAVHTHRVQHPMVLTFQALKLISAAAAGRIADALDAGDVPANHRSYASVSDPIVERAMELIWTHSHYPMSVSDIARQLPVTRRTLDRRFADAVGHSVLEEINTCRLSRAKRLLAETDLPVKSVARLAGFSSTERMRVVFIDREGVSPSRFRARRLEARHASGGVGDRRVGEM